MDAAAAEKFPSDGPRRPALPHGYEFGDHAIGHVRAPPTQPGTDGIPVYGPIPDHGDAPAGLVRRLEPDRGPCTAP